MKSKLYFVVGPTASGKTAVSINIAKQMDGEIISADSIQIYRKMDIGSAKPGIEERQGIVHHLFDVAEPSERNYSVARYREQALSCIEDIKTRKKAPIVCGGTGLYINSLIYPLDFNAAPPDETIRAHWKQMEACYPGSAHKYLETLDPARAKQLHPNDVKRVVRAIEICTATGRPVEAPGFSARDDSALGYTPVIAGLNVPREVLYRHIEQRVDSMMENGLLEEARSMYDEYGSDLPSMQGLGYKQLAAYLRYECTLDEAVAAIKLETRHFAKRQLTWFRREERIRWFNTAEYAGSAALADAIVQYFTEVDNG